MLGTSFTNSNKIETMRESSAQLLTEYGLFLRSNTKLLFSSIPMVLVGFVLTIAIKYNRPNGNIDVSLTVEDSSITIQINDTDIGIDEEDIQQLFERFYRVDKARKRDGTDLGLSIIQQIIHLHDGDISVKSKANTGTTFTIKLHL